MIPIPEHNFIIYFTPLYSKKHWHHVKLDWCMFPHVNNHVYCQNVPTNRKQAWSASNSFSFNAWAHFWCVEKLQRISIYCSWVDLLDDTKNILQSLFWAFPRTSSKVEQIYLNKMSWLKNKYISVLGKKGEAQTKCSSFCLIN